MIAGRLGKTFHFQNNASMRLDNPVRKWSSCRYLCEKDLSLTQLKKLPFVLLLLPAMLALGEDMAKYPLRVELLKDQLNYETSASQPGVGTFRGQSMPTEADVRTRGIAVVFADQESAEKANQVPGPKYKVVCEGEGGLAAGRYNARWDKKDAKLTLLAPRVGKPDKFTQVTCKASPYK